MSKNDRQASNEPLKVGSGASADGTLFKANNDLKNLMDASEIAIIFVDRDLRVKLFTSRAGDIFNLTDSGLGSLSNILQTAFMMIQFGTI